jgi:hypothetical protein
MNTTALKWIGHSLAVFAGAALLSGCVDGAPMGPNRGAALVGQGSVSESRIADVTACPELAAPAGSKLAFHTYADGVQIYRWNGASWSFVGPSAVLSADANGNSTVGIHYAGPNGPVWESNSGGTVVGAVQKRCPVDAGAIPWLLLGAVSTEGPGVFHRVTHIQRVNTVGGNAPANPGSSIGEEARVPYTAEYFFYREK